MDTFRSEEMRIIGAGLKLSFLLSYSTYRIIQYRVEIIIFDYRIVHIGLFNTELK